MITRIVAALVGSAAARMLYAQPYEADCSLATVHTLSLTWSLFDLAGVSGRA